MFIIIPAWLVLGFVFLVDLADQDFTPLLRADRQLRQRNPFVFLAGVFNLLLGLARLGFALLVPLGLPVLVIYLIFSSMFSTPPEKAVLHQTQSKSIHELLSPSIASQDELLRKQGIVKEPVKPRKSKPPERDPVTGEYYYEGEKYYH